MSDAEILLSPVRKRRRPSTDYMQCIICQGDKPENFVNAGELGIKRIRRAAKQGTDSVSQRLVADFENLVQEYVLYHKSCYSTYTSEIEVAESCSHDIFMSGPETRLSTDHAAQCNFDFCIFCQQEKKHNTKQTSTIETQGGALSISNIAKANLYQDEYRKVYLRINGVDLVAEGAKYHQRCRSKFVKSKKVPTNMTDLTGSDDETSEGAFRQAFQHVVGIIDESIL